MVEILVAGGLATAIALLGTPPFIRLLVRRRYGQHIRDDLAHHADKRGKPTMAVQSSSPQPPSATWARTPW